MAVIAQDRVVWGRVGPSPVRLPAPVPVSMSPARRLLPAILLGVISAIGGAWYLGVQPAIPTGGRVLAVAIASDTIRLTDTDRIEEPDLLDEWLDMDQFFARQALLAARLRTPGVTVQLLRVDGTFDWRPLTGARRPITSLPFSFWFQLLVGCLAVVIGGWVWSLRPADPATRAFAATGLGVLLSSHAAAIYSARDVALPGGAFRVLSAINHAGATLFGVALCALLMLHPRPLGARRAIPFVAAVAFLWWIADIARFATDQNTGTRLPLILEMVGAIVLAGVQWRRARHAPAERAVLRWLGMCVLLGPGLFIGILVVAAALGRNPPIPQAYGMGFFLITYVGMAIGLRRYRLFALDAWALRVLFWGIVVALFVGLDLVLLRVAGDASARLLFVVMMLALSTLPVRRWVWTHVLHRPTLDVERAVEGALSVSYAANAQERMARWRAYLGAMFEPLHIEDVVTTTPESAAHEQPLLLDEGERLIIPAAAGAPRLTLVHAGSGRRLFGPDDARIADRLVALMRQADASRSAYEAGIRRERQRIARDLHDTVSSPLLSGLAQVRAGDDASHDADAVGGEISRALDAMRDIVRASSEPCSLHDALADARFECVTRMQAAGLAVDWPLTPPGDRLLNGEERNALRAFFREATSNVLRHAGATLVTVRMLAHAGDHVDHIRVHFLDDGRGLSPVVDAERQGLANLKARAEELGGAAWVGNRPDGGGTEVRLDLPITNAASPA